MAGGGKTIYMARALKQVLKKTPEKKWQEAVAFSKRFIKAPEKSLKLVNKAQQKIAEIEVLPKVTEADIGYLQAIYNALNEIKALVSEKRAKEEAELKAEQAEAAMYAVMLNLALSKLREDLLIEMEDEELLLTILMGE